MFGRFNFIGVNGQMEYCYECFDTSERLKYNEFLRCSELSISLN